MNPLKDIEPKEVAEKVLELGRDKAAKHFNVNPSTFRDYLYRNNLPTKKATVGEAKPGVSIKDGQTAEVTSETSVDASDPEKIVKDRGLDPNEWEFSGMTVNEWDSPSGETLRQLKVQLKRKKEIDFIEAARIDGPMIPKTAKGEDVAIKEGIIIGDQHAPFFDEVMHSRILSLLGELKPKRGVISGDLVDFPEISRHPHNPAWKASTQECIDKGYEILRDYVWASPDTEWVFIEGNHENRLRNTVINHVKDLYGIRQGGEGAYTLSVEHLLRLDELGIKYVGDDNTYEYTKVVLNKNLGVVHGHIATKGSGTSALKTLDHFGHSIIQGHTHRQSQVFKTVRDIHDEPEILTAVETGCTCMIRKGIGYAPQSDWQQGCCTVTLHKNDMFKIDLATMIENRLLWRGEAF